jgi:hypothetical protein
MTHHIGAVPDTEPARAWLQHAACRADGIDPEWFYPDNNIVGIERARAICKTCPVRYACLADCLRQEGGRSSLSRWGVYAGLTPRQRVRLYVKLRDAGRRP